MSWRDNVKEERNRIAASTIGDGEWLDLRFQNDGEEVTTEAGDAVEFQCEYVGSQDGTEHTDMNDNPLEEGEEYILLTSSARLLGGLKDAGDSLSGVTARIHADGDTSSFDRTYDVETQ